MLFPADLLDYAKSLIAALLSVSNIYFWSTANYFEAAEKPLLHTWSLAVEEQFYLVLPPVMLLFSRFGSRKMRVAIAATAILSFVLSALTVRAHPSATFYLLPMRAWELLTGSLLALGCIPCPQGRAWREISSTVGICFIGFSVVHALTPFPGPLALVPCLGAVLLIAANTNGATIVGRVLSCRTLVGIGLISYSLYLWHVPVIVFSLYAPNLVFGSIYSRVFPFLSFAQAVTLERMSVLLGTSLLMAWLSYRFVERPFRAGGGGKRLRSTRPMVFATAAGATLALVVVGLVATTMKGFPRRFSSDTLQVASRPEVHYREGTCFVSDPAKFDSGVCMHLDSKRPNWMIMGDSTAAQLTYGLQSTYKQVNFLQATFTGCKPVPVFHYGESVPCFKQTVSTFTTWLPQHHVDGVILAANWQPYDLPRVAEALQRFRQLHVPVVLVGPSMHYDTSLARILSTSPNTSWSQTAQKHRILAYDVLDQQMAELAASEWKVPYFSYPQAFCRDQHCQQWGAPLVPLQWDDLHLTDDGSLLFAQHLKQQQSLLR